MALRFLLDENLRGPFAKAILRQNLLSQLTIDAMTVGEPSDLPLGSSDPQALAWASMHGHILVTEDRATMKEHLEAHLSRQLHSPGVFIVRPRSPISELTSFLTLVAHVSAVEEWSNGWHYIP